MKISFFLFVNVLFWNVSLATTINPGPTIKDPQIIGGVYNSKLNFFDPGVRCIEVNEKEDVIQVYNNESRVDYNENVSESTLVKEFGFGFGFELKPPTGDTYGFGFDFLNTFTVTKLSGFGVYKTYVFSGSEILHGPNKLTEEAMNISKKDPELFIDICGDEFVTRINKGGIGKVSVKIEIEVISNSSELDAEWSMGILNLGNFEANIRRLKESTDTKVKISVTGTQEGGFTHRINSIFGTGNGVASCVVADLDGCKVLLQDVVTYFSKEFVTQFDPYVVDNSGSGVLKLPVTAAPLSYITTSYCKLIPKHRPPHLNCDDNVDNSAEYDLLKNKKEEFETEIIKIEELGKNLKLILAPDFFTLIKIYLYRMMKNLENVQDSKINCHRDKWTCKNEVKRLLERLYPSQPEILSFIQNDERIQFCFKSGKVVEISGLEVRAKTGDISHKPYKIYGAPKSSSWDCFMFYANELSNEEFDGLEVRVKTKGEDQGNCRMRAKKKFSSWANWDLKAVTVKHFKLGHMKTFEGISFNQKMKCRQDQDSRYYLKWQTFKPRR